MNFQILLSDTCEFDGGEIFFEDGLSIVPNQGDLIIYSSKINHIMNNIKKGTQYLCPHDLDAKIFHPSVLLTLLPCEVRGLLHQVR